MALQEWAQPGAITVLLAVIGVLFAKRANNEVATTNARKNRESRFEENLQQRYETAMARNSQLRDENDELRKQLAAANNRLAVVQMVADNDPQRAVEISRDSAFIDLSRPIRPRETREAKPPSPSDPFQAADPYGPKRKK